MSIGHRPINPILSNASRAIPSLGMTYRQWLIGMALTGVISDSTFTRPDSAAQYAIDAADAVLRKLDEGPSS